MERSGARMGRRLQRPLFIVLLLAAVALLVLSGCARSRSTSSQSWSGVASDGVNAFVGTREGRLIQLSLDNGVPGAAPFVAPEPDQEAAGPAFYGTPTLVDGRVFVAGYHGVVFSLDAGGLGSALSFEIDGEPLAKGIAGEVVVAGDRLVVAATEDANEGRLYVIDAATMTETCRYPLEGLAPVGQLWTTPVVLDGVAYFGDLGHDVHAVNIDSCKLAWAAPAELGGGIVAPPVIVGNNLYVGTFDREFYSVDLATGTARSVFPAEGWFWAAPATDGQRLYVPNMDGHVYAYDPGTGQVAWKYPGDDSGDPILSSPAIIDGLLVFGDDGSTVTVLRTSDGGFERDRQFAGKIRAPITAAGDVALIHSLDETVSAFNIKTSALVWDRELDSVR